MPCSDLFWLYFLEVFPRVFGFALGILPVLLTIAGIIGGIHLWVDRDNRRYLLRLREETRVRQEQAEADLQRLRIPRSA
jgi:hypothetical protein